MKELNDLSDPRFWCSAQLIEIHEQKAIAQQLTPLFADSRPLGPPNVMSCWLARNCAPEIRTGAADGAEMGVWSHLKQPQREANLRLALDEYLRFGLEAGIYYET